MPKFIHIADEKNAKKIQKNGIKIGKGRNGIFCMPVTNKNHQFKETGEALKEFKKVEDQLGYEFLIERKIEAKEISKIKWLPQKIGWRYSPNSHKNKLSCGCPICISKGAIKSKKKREQFESTTKKKSLKKIIEALKTETNDNKIDELFWYLRRKKRKADPEILRFIFKKRDKGMIRLLALSLYTFQHPNTINMLLDLCQFEDKEIKENSVESIFDLKGDKAFDILVEFKNDKIIKKLLKEKKSVLNFNQV